MIDVIDLPCPHLLVRIRMLGGSGGQMFVLGLHPFNVTTPAVVQEVVMFS